MRATVVSAVVVVVLLAGALGPAAAADWPGFPVPRPLVLRLSGHFAHDRAAARAEGADAVSMRLDGEVRWFASERARTLGDYPLDGRDVLALVAPMYPNLVLVGPKALRERLLDATIGEAVELEGLLDRGSRVLLLRDVRVANRS
jgi:hypothetical protein